jgi:L-alanine-DL-glutamate epimerase-like enolase superfamily enzyme
VVVSQRFLYYRASLAVTDYGAMCMETDVRILELTPFFTKETPRVPLKFGAVVMNESAYCHVRARVENGRGQTAEGWGAIFMSDVWAWPSSQVQHPEREALMCDLVRAWCKRVVDFKGHAHPVDIFWTLEEELVPLSDWLCRERNLPENMPRLGALVCASPVDAAIHDAFGMAAGISTYDGYGPAHCTRDLSSHLGPEFAGSYIADFLSPPPSFLDTFHLVGGLDRLTESEIADTDPKDGLPVSLDQWIRLEQLHCLKIKLNGKNLGWDLDRILSVVKIARQEHARLGINELFLTGDTNEQCESPEYAVELLSKLREEDAAAFDALLYMEQPCERDLRARRLDVRKLARLKPVVIDEALASLEDFDLALDLGYSGVALKSCKCQSAELVMAAKAMRLGIPYSIQDLTNPGIALLHSAGLAAHLKPIKGVESNSRQFFPATSAPEQKVHPGVYRLSRGRMDVSTISGPGLGYQWSRVHRRFE